MKVNKRTIVHKIQIRMYISILISLKKSADIAKYAFLIICGFNVYFYCPEYRTFSCKHFEVCGVVTKVTD